jgi:regulatory protein
VRIRSRLRRLGYTETATNSAVTRVVQLGYVNDAAFAASRLSRRMAGGRGRRLIAAELRQRGIGDEIIGDLLAGIDLDEELEHATEAARRLIHAHREDSPAHGRDLVLAALVRRGYTPGLARTAYRAATAIPEGDEDAG